MNRTVIVALTTGALLVTGVPAAYAASPIGSHANDSATAQFQAREFLRPGAKATIVKQPVIRTWALNSKGRARQKVAVVPMYSKNKPDPAEVQSMMDLTQAFFEREIPGMRMKVTATKPVKMKDPCSSGSVISKAAQVSGMDYRSKGNHVVAYIPECFGAGVASLGGNRGWVKVMRPDASGQIMAHELGHNFGLNHGNVLECKRKGELVVLSNKCTQGEYDNADDAMGGGMAINGQAAPVTARRLGPVWQSLLTGRAKVTKPGKHAHVRLSSTGATGQQAAIVKSKFGAVYLGAIPKGDSSVMIAEVLTQDSHGGAARIQFPGVPNPDDTWNGPIPLPALGAGNSVVIPGSNTRVTVTNATAGGVTVNLTPADQAPQPVPAVPSADVIRADEDFTVRWTPSPGASAYFIFNEEGNLVARTGPDATQATVRWPTGLTVVAISPTGALSAPTPVQAGELAAEYPIPM